MNNLQKHFSRLREEFADAQSQAPTAQPQHQDFAEEAARAAQRYLDQIALIEQLTSDVDGWRNRATLAEAEIQRLEKCVAELQAVLDRKTAELTDDRDKYKQTVAVIAAQFTAASKILLDGFAVIDSVEGLQARVSMPALAAALEPHEPPLPGFIAKGPATDVERGA